MTSRFKQILPYFITNAKGCPFCNSQNCYLGFTDDWHEAAFVVCGLCRSRGPVIMDRSTMFVENEGLANDEEWCKKMFFKMIDDCIVAWNFRENNHDTQ